MPKKALRAQLADLLDWKQAHVGFDDAVAGVPAARRGTVPKGFAHSIWQVVEHIRIAQRDILDFCRNPRYRETRTWPDDYWPPHAAPRSAAAWARSVVVARSVWPSMSLTPVNAMPWSAAFTNNLAGATSW